MWWWSNDEHSRQVITDLTKNPNLFTLLFLWRLNVHSNQLPSSPSTQSIKSAFHTFETKKLKVAIIMFRTKKTNLAKLRQMRQLGNRPTLAHPLNRATKPFPLVTIHRLFISWHVKPKHWKHFWPNMSEKVLEMLMHLTTFLWKDDSRLNGHSIQVGSIRSGHILSNRPSRLALQRIKSK